MNRFFVFVFGTLFGAVAVFFLFNGGILSTGGRPADPRTTAGVPTRAPTGVGLSPPGIAAPTDVTPAPAPREPFTPAPVVVDPTRTILSAAAPAPETGALSLLIPVLGISTGQLADTYTQSRGNGRLHDAIDIMAARGTPVVAVDDGKVVKLFNSKPGGLTVYQFDRDENIAYYYAHLDSYAPGVIAGKVLKRGDLIGYVGSTGNASPTAPHLHFAVFVLGPEKHWWQGTAINPYPLLGGRAAGG